VAESKGMEEWSVAMLAVERALGGLLLYLDLLYDMEASPFPLPSTMITIHMYGMQPLLSQ